MADWWVWSPLAAMATPNTRGGGPFVILGMSHMILGVVHEWSSPHILGSISSGALGTSSFTRPFHSLPQVGAAVPFLTYLLSHLNFLA
jgi:hypothetical protein